LILIDLELTPVINPSTLQNVFELTGAKASRAIDVATGKSLVEIANARGVSIATARSQLASIFAKTYTAAKPN
jgi:hypothetical protein